MNKNYAISNYWILLLSVFQFFTISHIQAQYCTPTNVGNFNVNYISKVKFGSIDNSSSGTTSGYTYYSSVAATDANAGQTITGTISVTMNGWNVNTNTIAVWVNFNENADDDFEDSGERFLFTIKDNNNVGGNKVVNVPISIPIPSSAPAGASRIRVGFRTGDATNFTSCDYNWQAGEIEDYKINIISGSVSLPGDTVYQPNYCAPSNRGNFNVNYISNVAFGTINNSSTGTTGGYMYYSSVAAMDINAGETITGTVNVTINGWNVNTNTLAIWVNFNENEDDDFNDSGERFLFTVKDNRNIGGNKVVSVPISIPIPDNAASGFTMMRIGFRTGTDTNFTACDYNYQAGEIEDYKINIESKVDDDSDYFDSTPPSSATLYFNGKDNYVSGDSFIDGLKNITIMAWVKSDKGNSTDMVIAGEDVGCQLSLKGGNTPTFTILTEGKEKTIGDCKDCEAINFDEWHHITGSYSSSTGQMILYVDGILVEKKSVGKKDKPIAVSQNANKTFEIGRFSNKLTDGQYFKGNIDEVRVFDVTLSEDQIQQMVYQEIENNSGKVKGAIVKKDIQEIATGSTVSWKNLLAYYPFTDVKDRTIMDYSDNSNAIKLYNIKDIQEQTAPMPYTTAKDGDWTSESIWLHGDVWDVRKIVDKDWSIVKIASDVTISETFKTNGLIIDANKTLTVKGDNLVENNWYLELNGTLDLLNDSQLIQTVNSDLVTSATGKILRRQEGASNPFWYNYWSSPVGATKATALSNNNAATNNANNSDFRLELLKDGAGFNMQFTNGYTGNNSISTYWLYMYKNGVTYWDWSKVTKTTNISPGVGYTQKGTGVTGTQQQYIFEGKPNNGTIIIDVKDKGGKGSVPSVSATDYLLGNPYPSALSIHKFINDNKGVISGKLQLWQQWSGNSHNLKDYNGGYAIVNKLGSVRAYQFEGYNGATTGKQGGTLTPTKYLPVGQAFVAEIIADGQVVFKNSQRIFIKESDANNTYNSGSVFFKSTSGKTENDNNSQKTNELEEEEFKKIRLELNSVTGPATKRELLLGFSDVTSDGYDYGYDAENSDINNNDMHLNLDGVDMNIMAYSQISDDKVVPLNFKSSGSNSFEIKISDMENIDDSQEIYLKDNFTGKYFNLKESKPYSFTSEQGKFNERFEIVFQSEQKSLGVEEVTLSENVIYYQNSERKLFAKKINGSVTKLAIVNMLGQTTYELNNVSQDELSNGLSMPNVASGAYIAYFRTDTNQVLTKKIIIN
jgi:Concanavalin A-like lectin/glucanases superfamily/GEVED domain